MRPVASIPASIFAALGALLLPAVALADTETGGKVHHGGEASLVLPPLDSVEVLGMTGHDLLMFGLDWVVREGYATEAELEAVEEENG